MNSLGQTCASMLTMLPPTLTHTTVGHQKMHKGLANKDLFFFQEENTQLRKIRVQFVLLTEKKDKK